MAMNWSQESVEKVAAAIGKTYVPDGIWNVIEDYKTRDAAKAALSVVAELPEVAALLIDMSDYIHWREVNPNIKGGENYLKRFRAALTPFTNKGE